MISCHLFTFLTYVPGRTIIGPWNAFWCLTQDSRYMHSNKNLMLPSSSLWQLKTPVGPSSTDKPSGEFSCELATRVLLWTFQTYPLYSLWTKETVLIESQVADHGTCHGGFLVFFCASKILPHFSKQTSSKVTINNYTTIYNVAFV